MLFRYEALNDQGKKVQGAFDAESLFDAKQKLLRQSIFLTHIEALPTANKSLLNRNELLNFTRELSRLLIAGLPLYESLSALEEKYRGQPAQRLLLDLCEQVRAGKDFSAALAKHSKTFDFLYVAMIENAEKTGRLSAALEELSRLLAKQQQVRKQLTNALLYPALLFGFCLFVLGALLFYVVPSLRELFDGRDLHPFTKIVFAVSNFACNSKLFLATLALLIAAGIASFFFLPQGQRKAKELLVRIFPKLLAKVALIRFFRASSTLLSGSVPIVSAFTQAKTTMSHPILEAMIDEANLAISEGQPIHASFNHPSVPPLVPRMLSIAEKGGNLDSMMRQIAEIYEEDLERTLAHFTTMAQPLLLLFLGAIVGFVLLSVLLPLTDVSSFASS